MSRNLDIIKKDCKDWVRGLKELSIKQSYVIRDYLILDSKVELKISEALNNDNINLIIINV